MWVLWVRRMMDDDDDGCRAGGDCCCVVGWWGVRDDGSGSGMGETRMTGRGCLGEDRMLPGLSGPLGGMSQVGGKK